MPAYPVKMGNSIDTTAEPAPDLGQHTESVLKEILALSDQQIAGLKASGAIQ
jgi:crotonobetainyl-CoA:carnitine CoA-transferase CaiB-like acyl-CoA transferase